MEKNIKVITRRSFNLGLLAGTGALCIPSIALAESGNWTIEDGVRLIKSNHCQFVYFNTQDIASLCGSQVMINNDGIPYVVTNLADERLMKMMSLQFGFDDNVPSGWAYLGGDKIDPYVLNVLKAAIHLPELPVHIKPTRVGTIGGHLVDIKNN